MKRTWMFCLIGLLSLGGAAWSLDNKTGGGTEKAVAALEQQWLQSQKRNNPDLAAPLLADKFTNTGSDGKVSSKSEFLADAKATKYDSVDYDKAKGTDAWGKPLVDQRFTDTWVKMPNGHWQCVASHQSPAKM